MTTYTTQPQSVGALVAHHAWITQYPSGSGQSTLMVHWGRYGREAVGGPINAPQAKSRTMTEH